MRAVGLRRGHGRDGEIEKVTRWWGFCMRGHGATLKMARLTHLHLCCLLGGCTTYVSACSVLFIFTGGVRRSVGLCAVHGQAFRSQMPSHACLH